MVLQKSVCMQSFGKEAVHLNRSQIFILVLIRFSYSCQIFIWNMGFGALQSIWNKTLITCFFSILNSIHLLCESIERELNTVLYCSTYFTFWSVSCFEEGRDWKKKKKSPVTALVRAIFWDIGDIWINFCCESGKEVIYWFGYQLEYIEEHAHF